MRKIIKIILRVSRITFLTISAILILLSSFAFVLTILDSIKLELAINKQGLVYFLSLFDSFKALLASTFIIIPVYIALETLISNINNQEGKTLLDLRTLLNTPENLEIHKKLRGESGDWANGIPQKEKEDKDTWRKIDNYLGILELINILIDKNVISGENFDNQFGYRIDNVFHNQDIKEYIESYQNKDIIWKELLSLITKRGFK